MQNFSTFIFDVDGTIAHTNKLIFESFRHVAKKYLNKDVSDEEIISLFGPTEDVILKEWMKGNYETARDDYFEFYSSQHNILVKTFEGLEEILKLLQTHNKNLAVFTGKGKDSARITLGKLGLDKYFQLVVSGDDVVNHKPSHEGLEKIINYFNISCDEALMIGDSPHDIEAARDANIKVASVVWDSYAKDKVISMKPDYLFENVPELKSFVENILKTREDK